MFGLSFFNLINFKYHPVEINMLFNIAFKKMWKKENINLNSFILFLHSYPLEANFVSIFANSLNGRLWKNKRLSAEWIWSLRLCKRIRGGGCRRRICECSFLRLDRLVAGRVGGWHGRQLGRLSVAVYGRFAVC